LGPGKCQPALHATKIGNTMLMDRRNFGSTGLQAFPLGMGCSRFGSFLSTVGKKESLATIALALERGLDYFDTSDLYGQGESERLLGSALRTKRKQVLLATKAGRTISSQARLAAKIKTPIRFLMRVTPQLRSRVRSARSEHLSFNFNSDYLAAALHASLKRLRTDCVDVFMLHSPPVEVLREPDLFQRLARLREQGKVRFLGVSVADVGHAPLAASLPEVRAIQMPIGRRHHEALASILPRLRSQGIAVVGRELFEGLKPTDDQSVRGSVLRAALAMRDVSVVLVGMSSARHLEANLATLA
jgi:aryl-alcohol dehydrogenase-like predicted oxidoreductase